MKKKYGLETPFASPIRPDLPGGRLDKHYEIVRVQDSKDMVTYKIYDIGKNGRGHKEVARMGYAILPSNLVLGNVSTDKKYRKINLQKTLIRIAEQDAKTLGKEKLVLSSFKRAIPFYKKAGFKNSRGKTYDLAEMEKKVTEEIKWPKVKTFAERNAVKKRRSRV